MYGKLSVHTNGRWAVTVDPGLETNTTAAATAAATAGATAAASATAAAAATATATATAAATATATAAPTATATATAISAAPSEEEENGNGPSLDEDLSSGASDDGTDEWGFSVGEELALREEIAHTTGHVHMEVEEEGSASEPGATRASKRQRKPNGKYM